MKLKKPPFQFSRMPFGLLNAIQIFQWFIDSIKRNLDFVHVYIDHLSIASLDVDEHTQHMTLLFQRLSDNEIVASPDKYEVGETELTFPSHEITRKSLKVCEDAVCAILDYAILPSIKELKAFLELLLSWLRSPHG